MLRANNVVRRNDNIKLAEGLRVLEAFGAVMDMNTQAVGIFGLGGNFLLPLTDQ